jgi:hypothetical protein
MGFYTADLANDLFYNTHNQGKQKNQKQKQKNKITINQHIIWKMDLENRNDDTKLEYVLLDDNDNNEKELWEIDYNNNIALNVSEVIKPDSIDGLLTYSGKIEAFLLNERGCDNIHFHDSLGIPTRIHLNVKKTKLGGCTFK